MANFLFYKYRFEPTGERTLFSAEDGTRVSSEHLNGELEELIGQRAGESEPVLNLYCVKTDRNGVKSPELYTNEIKRFDGGVALLEVRNNKFKKVMPRDKNESVDVEHCPVCRAIVDTRPGRWRFWFSRRGRLSAMRMRWWGLSWIIVPGS